MKKTLASALLALALLAAIPGPAAAQVKNAVRHLDQAKALWLRKQYQAAFPALDTLARQPYGRRPDVYFMLGTSACQVGRKDYGAQVLAATLRFSLRPSHREAILEQIVHCRAGSNAPIIIVMPADIPTSSGGWGKTYYWLDAKLPVSSYPARRVRELTAAEMEGRLFLRASGPPTAAAFSADGCRPVVGKYVVICSSAGISRARLTEIATESDQFIDWLERSFGIAPAEEYLTVRLVKDRDSLKRAARSLHGLDVSDATIAYSFQDDLSAIAVTAGSSGSILHELTHLALRRDFGDAPQWFEEGLASLYEVSIACDGAFYGVDNWRGDLLRRHWPDSPSVAELVNQAWFSTIADRYDGEAELPTTPSMGYEFEVAQAEAKMRYLAFYMQEQGKLQDIYRALKSIDITEDYSSAASTVMQSRLGLLDSLDEKLNDFARASSTGSLRRAPNVCQSRAMQIRKDLPQPYPRSD